MLLNLPPTAAQVDRPEHVGPQRTKFALNTSPALRPRGNTSSVGTVKTTSNPSAVSFATAAARDVKESSATSGAVQRMKLLLPAAFAEYWQ